MYKYRQEKFDDVFPEIVSLIKLHYQEVETDKDRLRLDPDFEMYKVLEKAGNLRIYTIRKDEELVGYAIFVLNYNMHHREILFAVADLIFVHPDHRKGGGGAKIMLFSEKELEKEGVKVAIIHSKWGSKIRKLFERLGYRRDEVTYRKFL